MKVIDTLLQQFRLSQYCAQQNANGVTHEDSLLHPEPGGNDLNWVLGHVVATRCLFLPSLGEQSPWSQDLVDSYKRNGTKAQVAPFDEIIRMLEETYTRLERGLAQLPEEKLATPAPMVDPNDTLGTMLVTCAFHESYHVGQTGVLRRVAGKEGVIK